MVPADRAAAIEYLESSTRSSMLTSTRVFA